MDDAADPRVILSDLAAGCGASKGPGDRQEVISISHNGVIKREPVAFRDNLHSRYMELSKADWADAFTDLYRETMGEDAWEEQILADAERRIGLLKAQGIR